MTPITVLIQAKDNLTKVFGSMGGKLREFGGSLKGAFTGLIAGGAMLKFLGDLKSYSDAIVRAREATGLTVGQLEGLNFVANQAGLEVDKVTKSIVKLNNAQQEAKDGSDAHTKAFERLGISMGDVVTLSPDQLFSRVAKAVTEASDRQSAMNAVSELFGEKVGPKMMEVLKGSASGLDSLASAAERAGAAVGEAAITAADKFDDAMHRMESRSKGFAGRRIEAIGVFAEAIKNWYEQGPIGGKEFGDLLTEAYVKGRPEEYGQPELSADDMRKQSKEREDARRKAEADKRRGGTVEEIARLEQQVADEERKAWLNNPKIAAKTKELMIEREIAALQKQMGPDHTRREQLETAMKVYEKTQELLKVKKEIADAEEKTTEAQEDAAKEEQKKAAEREKQAALDRADALRKTADRLEASAEAREARLPNLRTLAVGSAGERRNLLSELKEQAKQQRKLERTAERAEEKEWQNQQRGALKHGLTSREKAAMEWAREAEGAAREQLQGKAYREQADALQEKANRHLESIDTNITKAISLS